MKYLMIQVPVWLYKSIHLFESDHALFGLPWRHLLPMILYIFKYYIDNIFLD